MKKIRFTEEQMVGILREADRSPVVKRLRELEAENAKLERMVVDRLLTDLVLSRHIAIETLKEINRRKW